MTNENGKSKKWRTSSEANDVPHYFWVEKINAKIAGSRGPYFFDDSG